MHELSIAQRIVETVEQILAEQSAPCRVRSVNLRVGALSGVVPQALEFAWDVATGESLLAGSTLAIEFVPIAVYCPRCDAERELPGVQCMRCPVCGTGTPAAAAQVVRGRELEILSLEVDDGCERDDAEDASGPHADHEEERRAGSATA